MNIDRPFDIPSQVMARVVGDETILLNLETGTYFGLDPIGGRIWQLLSEGKTLADVCDVMFREYDVPRASLEQDILELAEKLAAQGLISVT